MYPYPRDKHEFCKRVQNFLPVNNFVHRFQHARSTQHACSMCVCLRSLVYYTHRASFESFLKQLLVFFRLSFFFVFTIQLNCLFEFYIMVAFIVLIFLCCSFIIFLTLTLYIFIFFCNFFSKPYSAQMSSAYLSA